MDETYSITAYPPFAVTVDLAVLTIRGGELCVLVIKRAEQPFQGTWALPGGFVHRGPTHSPESLDQAATRELREETGLGLKKAPYLAQLGAYGDPQRDPRGDVVTVAYLVVGTGTAKPHPGGDAAAVGWLPVSRLFQGYQLAFDHDRIVKDGVERVRELVQYTALAVAFCGPRFSVSNLRRAYEILWGLDGSHGLDAGNFHHRVLGMKTLLQEARSQAPPIGLERLGLGPRPRQQALPSAPGTTGRAASRPGELDQALSEPLAGSASSGGPRPRFYEPGPLIKAGGYTAPLERPFLNPRKGSSTDS